MKIKEIQDKIIDIIANNNSAENTLQEICDYLKAEIDASFNGLILRLRIIIWFWDGKDG